MIFFDLSQSSGQVLLYEPSTGMRTVSFLADFPSAETTSKIIWPLVASALVSAVPSVTKGFLPFRETPLIPVMISPFLNLPSAGEAGTVFSTLMATPL